MNETIQTLLFRRSIRTYNHQAVSQKDLELVLECGLYAPSGSNHQVVRFTVIQNPMILEDLVTLVRDEFRRMPIVEGEYMNKAIINEQNKPKYDFGLGAPELFIGTAPIGWPNGMADSAVALQNMQLAATSLGLGACWVNQLHWLTQNEVLRKFLQPYGIESSDNIYGSIVLGNTSHYFPKAAPRKKDSITYVN